MTANPTEQTTPPPRARMRLRAVLSWALCGVICIAALVNMAAGLANRSSMTGGLVAPRIVAWSLLPIVFAVPAALIIARQPRNRLGWVLMAPPISFVVGNPIDIYLSSLPSAPQPTVPLLLMAWFQNWSWLLLIMPLLLVLLLFPAGHPPSPRWRWVEAYAAVVGGVLVFVTTFGQQIGDESGSWSVRNPIGFVPTDPASLQLFTEVWVVVFAILVILCAAALFARYRRASASERLQIKWLLYAGAVFVAFYVPLLLGQGGTNWAVAGLSDLMLALLVWLFPIAIGIAILRYRLWDIDIIINRTLVYVPLTAISAAIFSEVMSLSEKAFVSLTGSDSPVSAVIAAVIVVAAFNPIKDRVQKAVDRKFKEAPDPAKRLKPLQEQIRNRLSRVEVERAARRLLDEAVAAFDAEAGAAYLEVDGERRVIHTHGQWKDEEELGAAIDAGGRRLAYVALGPRRRDRGYTAHDRQTLLHVAQEVGRAVEEDAAFASPIPNPKH